MNFFFVFLLTLCLVYGQPEVSSEKRNNSGEEPEIKKEPECPGRLPCGWLVYNKSTRVSEFFMNNTCKCPPEKSCVLSDDMLSAGAYIFRCTEIVKVTESLETTKPEVHADIEYEETSQSLAMSTKGLTSTTTTVRRKISDPQPSNNIKWVFFNLFQHFLSYPKYKNGRNKFQKERN